MILIKKRLIEKIKKKIIKINFYNKLKQKNKKGNGNRSKLKWHDFNYKSFLI
jgi:hypothetical protein